MASNSAFDDISTNSIFPLSVTITLYPNIDSIRISITMIAIIIFFIFYHPPLLFY